MGISPKVRKIILDGYISPQAAAFLVRANVGGPHRRAYIKLINKLVQDNVWPKLDGLYFPATLDSATGIKSLVSSTYDATINGTPTFTANSGFVGANTNNFLDTNFDPSAMTSGNYVNNSNLLFGWSLTAAQDAGFMVGAKNDATNRSVICPRNTSDQAPYRSQTSGLPTPANADGTGFYSVERTGASTTKLYRNGILFDTDNASASIAFNSANLTALAVNGAGNFWSGKLAIFGFGGPLGVLQKNLYDACHAYLQTIAGIA